TTGNESTQTISVDVWLRPVVINEIAWAGTGSSATTSKDEWIELYNPTPKTISLANILLDSPTNNSFKINLSGTIASHGYYLIERTKDDAITDILADLTAAFGSGLSNSGEQLVLKLGSTTIDATPPSGTCPDGWCAGSASGQYYTMERYDPLSSGENQTNWASWQDIVRYGTNAEAQPVKGTPKHRNALNYAIVIFSTNLSTNKTLTKANSPYIISTQINISQSATLTIEPGVVVKFNGPGSGLYGSGIILAKGSAADPIIFTSFADDSYAGDTNQNGTSTSPQAGDWGLIQLLKTGSLIDHAIITYGGEGIEKANIKVKNANVNITNSTVEYSKYYGISFENAGGTMSSNIIRNNTAQHNIESTGVFITGNSAVTVNGNTFTANYAGLRIYSTGISAIYVMNNIFTSNTMEAISSAGAYPSFSGNTATGNGINGIVLQSVAYENDVLERDLPYVVSGPSAYIVSAGKKVTIMPGVIMKFGLGSYIDVAGILEAKGTAANPIIFTSFYDDDCGIAGGCGNTDNASTTPRAGDWSMITFGSTSGPSQLEYVTVRYGGKNFYLGDGAIQLQSGASTTLSHATLEKNYGMGMRIEHASSIISDSLIQDHKGTPSVGQFYGL
ncbi:MAG: right-handed parallel beta-helix repeat-containing protein, partial [Patescibacteria group bacterium]